MKLQLYFAQKENKVYIMLIVNWSFRCVSAQLIGRAQFEVSHHVKSLMMIFRTFIPKKWESRQFFRSV